MRTLIIALMFVSVSASAGQVYSCGKGNKGKPAILLSESDEGDFVFELDGKRQEDNDDYLIKEAEYGFVITMLKQDRKFMFAEDGKSVQEYKINRKKDGESKKVGPAISCKHTETDE